MEKMQAALQALKEGKPIIIVDDYKRENEGDLVASSQTITDATMQFMITHSSGVVCLSMLPEQVEKLKLPMMNSAQHSKDKFETAFAYSIESSYGIGTGISAKDRAFTIRVAGNPSADYKDVISPGHIFPLKAKPNLLQERQGHTEASIAMCQLAGLYPSAALVEIPNTRGGMLNGEELEFFAEVYRLPIVSIKDIMKYKEGDSSYVKKYSESKLPTEFGDFNISVWHNIHKEELVVISKGDLTKENIPLRIHSKCLTGDVFHSKRCDCRQQLEDALVYINECGVGMVLYLDQEGRGITLAEKIKTYLLQEQGLDTVEANIEIGRPVDNRTWDFAQGVLRSYNLKSVEILTGNPDKVAAVKEIYGDKVKIKSIPAVVTDYNKKYLETKRKKMHHNIVV